MIPVFTLKRQNQFLRKELRKAIDEVIKSGIFILGTKVMEFERAFADYLGVKYAIGVASGTEAISLALMALGVGRGDEVIMPANSYPTAFAISAVGAIPKLVDIDPNTYTINPQKILPAISQKTKAVIAVHLYGQPADLTSIYRYIDKSGRKIPLIEDCAQAHGAEVNFSRSLKEKDWKKVGSLGDVACFSFYPTKNLGCFGDGGMVVTNNEEIYKKVKLLRMYGEEKRYQSIILGRNSRLDEIQAAILLVKLKYLDRWNERRRKIGELYFSLFSDFPISLLVQRNREERKDTQWEFAGFSNLGQSGGTSAIAAVSARMPLGKKNCANIPKGNILLPLEASYAKHIYHLFVIRTKKRDQLRKYLEEKGIQTAIHYPTPIHLMSSFRFLGRKEGDFPESEKASREILSLPMWPELREKEVESVVRAIQGFSLR